MSEYIYQRRLGYGFSFISFANTQDTGMIFEPLLKYYDMK